MEYLETLVEKTGWDPEYARQKLDEAKERLGVSEKDYVLMGLYHTPEEEQEKKIKDILELRMCAADLAEMKGLEVSVAKRRIRKAMENFGITAGEYMKMRLYSVPSRLQQMHIERYREQHKKR